MSLQCKIGHNDTREFCSGVWPACFNRQQAVDQFANRGRPLETAGRKCFTQVQIAATNCGTELCDNAAS
jgi:hypothetical protein